MMATMIDSPLFGELFSTEEMRKIFSDENTIQKWLDVEAALARAEAKLGIIAAGHAEEITRKARVELIDMAEMKRQLFHTHHPIMPLIRCFQKVCEPKAGEYIHWGATTQDIMDTGAVLQLKEANAAVVRDLNETRRLLSEIALKYKDTVEAGRTHGQHALPITFGYKVGVWVAEVKRHLQRIEDMSPRVFQGQFAGAVGTLASIGDPGFKLQELMFADLKLEVPEIAWHTARDTVAEFVCVYAMIGSTLAKIADEIIGLQRTEVAEVEEPFHMGKVGSSTMPHKRNPMMSEGVVAICKLLQNQVSPALADMLAENERDQRGWMAEWAFLPDTCCYLSGMLFWTNKVLSGLVVYPENMTRNLDALHGLLLSENIMLALGEKIGRQAAHDVVYELSMEAFEKKIPLKSLLLKDKRVNQHLNEKKIDDLLDPAKYTGLAAKFAERVSKRGK
ncbi:MAG TPA: adenylosuccinate lyase [Thermodesulfobacteriota bacterium]|nr:adenylosuccinate lyase [Thermodesulfobacteriota bacterium]